MSVKVVYIYLHFIEYLLIILAFRLILAYELLEDRCTIDVITFSYQFFPLCFKVTESFEI